MPFLGRAWALVVESSNAKFGGSRGVVAIGEQKAICCVILINIRVKASI